MKTLCAWCMKEEGVAPKPSESHTICQMHMAFVLAEYGLENAANVARTYKDLRVERNTDLDTLPDRLEREGIGWRTFLLVIGVGFTVAALCFGAVLLMAF